MHTVYCTLQLSTGIFEHTRFCHVETILDQVLRMFLECVILLQVQNVAELPKQAIWVDKVTRTPQNNMHTMTALTG